MNIELSDEYKKILCLLTKFFENASKLSLRSLEMLLIAMSQASGPNSKIVQNIQIEIENRKIKKQFDKMFKNTI